MIEVLFFVNGNTGVFEGGEQIPDLQRSWFILFMEHLENKGIDPDGIICTLPNGERATVFRTPDNDFSWRFS